MEKPSLSEVKEYFKNALIVESVYGTRGNYSEKNLYIDNGTYFCKSEAGVYLVIWKERYGYAKILTYKNTEPKFEITKEQILKLYNTGNPQPTIKKMFPEVFETKLKVGKWYIVTNIKTGSLGFEGIGQYTKEKPQSGLLETDLGFNFRDVRGRIWRTNGDIRLATPEEVTEALKNEAVNRYKKGDYIKCLNGVTVKAKGNTFDYKEGCLYLSDSVDVYELFSDGVWAEIIPTKTIQQAEEFLKELGHEIKIV